MPKSNRFFAFDGYDGPDEEDPDEEDPDEELLKAFLKSNAYSHPLKYKMLIEQCSNKDKFFEFLTKKMEQGKTASNHWTILCAIRDLLFYKERNEYMSSVLQKLDAVNCKELRFKLSYCFASFEMNSGREPGILKISVLRIGRDREYNYEICTSDCEIANFIEKLNKEFS